MGGLGGPGQASLSIASDARSIPDLGCTPHERGSARKGRELSTEKLSGRVANS